MANIILQANLKQNTIFYEGKLVSLDKEKTELLCQQLGEFWHNDKDYILLFEYYDDGSCVCERKKQIYDYRYREFSEKIYIFNEFSEEQSAGAYKIFASFYEESRLIDLRNAKNEVQRQVNEFMNIVQVNIRLLRSNLLNTTDWVFMEDAPKNEERKAMYIKFRQALRDIPQNDEKFESDPLNVKIPMHPDEYLKLYPNKEVEYLSTPEQFVQHYFEQIKNKLLRFQTYLSLPSTRLNWSMEANPIEVQDFDMLAKKIQKTLHQIDTSIVVPPLQFTPAVNTNSVEYIDSLIKNAEHAEQYQNDLETGE